MIRHDWRIVKSDNPKFGRWNIESRAFIGAESESGAMKWEMAHNWTRHSAAPSKRAALARIMLLRERGEPVSWEGGRPIRLGIVTFVSC